MPGDGMTNAELLERVRAIEWVKREYGGGAGAQTGYVVWECASCRADRVDGHKDGCWWEATIREMEEVLE